MTAPSHGEIAALSAVILGGAGLSGPQRRGLARLVNEVGDALRSSREVGLDPAVAGGVLGEVWEPVGAAYAELVRLVVLDPPACRASVPGGPR